MKIPSLGTVDQMEYPYFELCDARRSRESDLPVKVVFVDPYKVGIHEDHDPEKIEPLLRSILKVGFKGPAISVMDSGNLGIHKGVTNGLPLEIDNFDVGIMDGHNRLAIFKILDRLGVLNHSLVPVQLVSSDTVLVHTRSSREDTMPLPISEVQRINRIDGATLSNQSPSHFRIYLRGGDSVRFRESQPDTIIERDELIDITKFDEIRLDEYEAFFSEYMPVDKLKSIFAA